MVCVALQLKFDKVKYDCGPGELNLEKVIGLKWIYGKTVEA